MNDLVEFAATLDDAARTACAIPQLSQSAALDVRQAYEIQAQSIERRRSRGERIIGVKLGFTSRAKALQMGVHDLILGRLTDRMLIDEGGEVDLARFVHPRIEPELAFRLKRSITMNMTATEAIAAIGAVAPAMELIDSRYRDFKFNLPDVVADNCSSAALVIGAWQPLDRDIADLGVVLEFDGRPAQIGSTTAILGQPLRALAAAARLAANVGLSLRAGWIVLAGAATAAEPLTPGLHIRAVVQHLGCVSLHTSRQRAVQVDG